MVRHLSPRRSLATSTCVAVAVLAVAAFAHSAGQPAAPAAAQPAAPGAMAVPGVNQAMVRFVHAAPTVELQRIVMIDAVGGAALQEFTDVAYLDTTDYTPVLAGDYDFWVELAGVEAGAAPEGQVPAQRVTTVEGQFYTVVLIGLPIPGETTRDTGFFQWLEGLFTPDRTDLGLRLLVLDDLVTAAVPLREAEIRIVHAAPGTDSVDLVLVRGADVHHLEQVAYGDVSRFNRIVPEGAHLEVRVAGSQAALLDLGDVDLAAGMIHTVFLAGTPVEDVPLEGLVASNQWIDPLALPGVRPGGIAAPVPGALPAADAAWIRDRLLEVEAWLQAAEARLVEVAEAEGADDQIQQARIEVTEARAALDEARLQLETVMGPAAPLPGTTPAAPAQPAEGADPDDATDPEDADDADEPAQPGN
jgi:hypothetical protein